MADADKDIALGILQAAIAVGGVLLIFMGFLMTAASQTSMKTPRVKLKIIAVCGLVPFIASLACAWQSVWAIQGDHTSATCLFISVKIVLGITAFYAILATLFGIK